MSRKFAVLCGVPEDKCTGGSFNSKQALGTVKAHGSHEQAFKCMVRYLLDQGYERIATRDFRPPDGGPIRMLTRKSRFGARLRRGKEGTRLMPAVRTRGTVIG